MTDNDLISSLGLGAETSTETAAPAAAETAGETVGEVAEGEGEGATEGRAKRSEIKITQPIVKKQAALLPSKAVGGGFGGKRGSKYPFETLDAPTKDAEGTVTGYDYFEVLLKDVENADQKKLQAAIQAATANANKAAKEANEPQRFVSRTVLGENEEYVGSAVYRVDDTIDGEDD